MEYNKPILKGTSIRRRLIEKKGYARFPFHPGKLGSWNEPFFKPQKELEAERKVGSPVEVGICPSGI